MKRCYLLMVVLLSAATLGCACGDGWCGWKKKHPQGPPMDRPLPLGQATDSFWEGQQTNAEAADFIFYDHEFRYDTVRHVDTAELAPGAKRQLEQVALRLAHVPFPVVIEASQHQNRPELDQARRQTIVEHLARMGVTDAQQRVVVAPAFAEGRTAIEAEQTYSNILGNGFNGGLGRRFGGTGGAYR